MEPNSRIVNIILDHSLSYLRLWKVSHYGCNSNLGFSDNLKAITIVFGYLFYREQPLEQINYLLMRYEFNFIYYIM